MDGEAREAPAATAADMQPAAHRLVAVLIETLRTFVVVLKQRLCHSSNGDSRSNRPGQR